VVAVGYSLAVWWPTRALPYHWDSATFVVDASRDLLASGFWPLIAGHSDFAHPPLFVAALAVAWKVFGDSRVVSHALVLPALPAAIVATYRMGSRLVDRLVGACAAVLFATVAVVVAEYGQVYMDLPVAAVLAWGIVAWVERRRTLACLLFCAAALMKIPAPLSVPAGLLLSVLGDRLGGRECRRATRTPPDRLARRSASAYVCLGLPFAVDGLWLAYHRWVTGWTLSRRPVTSPAGLHDFGVAFEGVVTRLFLDQWRWVPLVLALAAVAWVRARRGQWTTPRPVAPLLAVIFAGVMMFSIAGEFGLRYGIYLLPAYFVSALYFVREALPAPWPLAAGTGLLVALSATTWHPRAPLTAHYEFRPDEDLAYRDVIAIGLRSAHWLAQNRADAEIYGAGPESYELTEPWQGYVDAPLQFAWCKSFERHPDRTQIIVVHAYHPQQLRCRRLTEELGARPTKHFESGSKWLELYEVPRSEPQDGGTK
jgi:hypothetical protein